jgi:hypothetical protein
VEKGGFAERLKAARAAPAATAPSPEAATTAPVLEPSSTPALTVASEAPLAEVPAAAPAAEVVAAATAPAAEVVVAAAVPVVEAVVAATAPAAEVVDAPGELEVWFWDEMRLGLHGQVRRVWAPVGEKVEQLLQIQYKWSHLVLAVCPSRGEVRWCWVPNLKGPTLAPIAAEWFGPKASAVLVWDGAPGHRNHAVAATGVRRVLLPPYSPELDPAERVFRAIRPEVEGQVYATLEEKKAIVEAWLRDFGANPARVRSLTAWSWLLEQIRQAA